MKALLVGEGPNDIGQRNFWCERSKSYVDLEGWLQPLVRAIRSSPEDEIYSEVRDRLFVDTTLLKRSRPLPKGHGTKALLAKRAAALLACDAVVYMVDADAISVKRWREICAEIEAGFSAIAANLKGVACVPMSTSESWLLSDEDAWAKLGGPKPTLPKNPELIWGERRDPLADHPHQLFRRVCDGVGVADNSETRNLLANETQVAVLRARCSISFPSFEANLLAA